MRMRMRNDWEWKFKNIEKNGKFCKYCSTQLTRIVRINPKFSITSRQIVNWFSQFSPMSLINVHPIFDFQEGTIAFDSNMFFNHELFLKFRLCCASGGRYLCNIIDSLTDWFIHSFIDSLNQPLVPSISYLLVHWFIASVIHWLINQILVWFIDS
jgi:hypothetical protein